MRIRFDGIPANGVKMKIAVLGATGNLGSRFVKSALKSGHQITAFVRSPEKFDFKNENLTVIKGDVFNVKEMTKAFKGMDAVASFLRLHGANLPLFSKGTENIIQAMKANNIKRLIITSEAIYGKHATNFSSGVKLLAKLYGTVNRKGIKEREEQDKHIYNSDLDWTIIRVRTLKNGESNEKLKIEFAPRSKISGFVSNEELAPAIVKMFEQPEAYIKRNVYI